MGRHRVAGPGLKYSPFVSSHSEITRHLDHARLLAEFNRNVPTILQLRRTARLPHSVSELREQLLTILQAADRMRHEPRELFESCSHRRRLTVYIRFHSVECCWTSRRLIRILGHGVGAPKYRKRCAVTLKTLSVFECLEGRGGVFEKKYSNFTTTRPSSHFLFFSKSLN